MENLDLAFQAMNELADEKQRRQEQTDAQVQPYATAIKPTKQKTESNSNPAFAVIDEMQAERRRSAGALVDGDAMKAAKVRDLSERYGTTRTAAEINYDTLFAQANRDDADEVLTQSPALARYFAENQKDAPIFKDDLGVLSRIEEGFRKIGSRYSSNSNEPVDAQPNAKYWGTEETTGDAALDERIRPMVNSSQIGRGAQAGWLIGQQGLMWAEAGNNKTLLNAAFEKRDEEIDKNLEQLAGDDSDAAFYNAAQIVGTMLSTMLGGSEGAVAGGALATGAMAVGAAPVSVPVLLGGMALGMGTEGTRKVEGGLSLKTLIDQGVPYEKAVQIAGSVGAVNSLIEMGGVSVLGKAFSPIAKSLNSLLTSKSVKALESPTLRSAFMDVARLYTMGVGQEVITEAAQEVTSMVGEEVGRLWGETGAKGISMDEAIDRILDVGEMTLKGSAVLGALSTGPVMVNHVAKINRANQTKEFFENLTKDVAQMKGANLSPGATKEVIDGVAQDAGAGTIYVDGYAFRQVMVEAGVRPEDLDQVVPGLSQQVDAAAVNGTDVTMSTGDFAARLAASPFGQKLVPHMRLNENDLSQVEADNLAKSVRDMRRAAVRYAINPDEQIVDPEELKVENDATLTPEQKEEQRKAIRIAREQRHQADKDARDAYVTGITNSLTQAGFSSREARTQARFAGAVMSNLAKRLEMPVQEAVDRYGVSVAVGEATNSESVSQAAIDKFAMQRLSYAFDEELAKWQKGKGDSAFDLGAPSWVLQIFGVDASHNIVVNRQQFVHVLFPKGVSLTVNGKTVHGKHNIPAKELRGILVAIQQPLTVFRSRKKQKKGTFSIVLLTELAREINGEKKNIVVPIQLTGRRDGKTVVVNEVSSAYEKRDISGWMNDLLGVEKTKGLEAVHQFLGSISSAGDSSRPVSGGPTPTHRSPSEAMLPDGVIVYENDSSVGDIYQGGGKIHGAFSPVDNRITLTPNADLSTFSHEMGHWYLSTLFAVARAGDATPSIIEDVNAVLKEFGIANIAEWDALGFEGQRKYHERFASWTEQYLAEAKAPVGLKKFFRTLGKFIRDAYRTFMAGVVEGTQTRYRQETGEELPMFSEEVRRVLDRMVAGEAAVEQNEQAQSLTPLFETKPDGMSDEEWREYAAEHDDAVQSGAELLVKAQAKDERWYSNARSKVLKEMQARAEEIRKNTRERVEARLMKSREFTALNILQSSDRPGIAFDARINPKSLDGLLEAGQIETLRKAGVLKDGGVDVKVSRELLRPFANFRSDRTFLNGLLRVADKEKVIEEQTTADCLKKYGELFDPVKRDKAVSKALHNEARGRMVATELKYLINDKEARSRVYLAAARQAAMALVDRTRIGKAKVATFLSAEGRAARRALEAFRKGDLEAAANFKRQQIVNHEAARLVTEAEDKREKLKELRNLAFKSDKKLAARYDTNIMAIARAVLTNRNMGKATENVDDAVEEILKKVKQYDLEIFEGLKSFIDRHPFSPGRDPSMLSVAEFIGVVDDVQALVTMARDARRITLDGKKQDLDQAIEELKKAILSTDSTRFRPGQKRASTKKEENRKLYFTARAFVMRVENWCRAMDNGQDLGPFTRYIFRPVADAAAKYRVKNAEIQERFAALIKPMEEKWEEVGEIEAPELGYTFERKSELIGALMHIGNESNKSKMLIGGRGEDASWADRVVLANGEVIYSYARWDRFFARAMREGIITKDDMDFVQAVWDLLEETKGMSQKAFKEYYGFYFDEVQASPVVTPWGIYRGGYVPAATDPMLVAGRDKQIEQDLFESQSEYRDMMPVTQPGWSKAREKKYYKPLVLNVGMLGAHIQSVVKFAMMAPAVKNVQRIVKDRRFADLMNDIDPKVISDMLTPWLRRSATQTISTPTNAFGRILNQVRGLAGMSLMAGNVANVLQQYTGFSIAMSEVGARNTAQGLKEYLRDTKSAYARVTEASTFMKGRLEDFCFEYQNEVNRIASSRAPTKVEEVRDWTQRKAYILQTLAQRTIDIPVWLAAYNQAITEKGMADADAVFYADSVVRRTQSSFDPESVSRVETGDPLQRSILVFYNYFNMQLNLLRESYTRAKTAGKYGRFALDFAMIVAIPAILSEVIAQAFSGFDTGDDDDWDAVDGLQLAITSVNKNMVAMLPFFGNVINMTGTKMSRGDYGAVSDVSKMLFGNNPYNDKLVSVPVMSLFENSAEGAKNLLLLLFSEEYDPDPRRAARNTLDLLTLMTGIPFSGVKKPVGYLAGVAGDEYGVDNPVDFTRGFISGKDPNAE